MKVTHYVIAASLMAGMAYPVQAQTAAPVPATSPTTAKQAPATPPSADRIAAARPVIDRLWPLGTYRRIMTDSLSDITIMMTQSAMGMKLGDIAPSADIAAADKGKTLSEIMEKSDPQFRERMRIMAQVMNEEMIPLMDKVEPSIRTALTTIYARRYTTAQLRDLDQFLATPTGKLYAENWITSFYDPEIMTSMQNFMPDLMKAMPAIMKKVEARTAHLKPIPAPTATRLETIDVDSPPPDDADGNDDSRWSAADRKAVERQEATVAGAESRLADQRGRLDLLKYEARLRAGETLSAEDQAMLNLLRASIGKK